MRVQDKNSVEIRIERGNPERLGAFFVENGVNFAFAVPGNLPAELLLYQGGQEQPTCVIPLPGEDRVGCVAAVLVRGIRLRGNSWEYSYRVDGREMADPYGRLLSPEKKSPRCLLEQPAGARTSPLDIPYEDCIFYKLHVRGFTCHKASRVRHKGSFRGLQDKIPYLKELGVTSLILMPVYEFCKGTGTGEDREGREDRGDRGDREGIADRENRGDRGDREYKQGNSQPAAVQMGDAFRQEWKDNYWGYTGGLYFAPCRAYSWGKRPDREFADLVDALHEAGLECVLEFYFRPEESVQKVVEILHYWRLQYQVDGFHLVGGGSWARPVAEDPLLSRSKLLFESCPVDENALTWKNNSGRRSSQKGRLAVTESEELPGRYLAEMNKGYEVVMRRFLKGDGDCLSAAVWYLRKNGESVASVSYFADQDGFTMADMVAYERKHNEENGEGGRDGTSDNFSWNCGVEGPTRRAAVRKLRMQQLYNAFLILLTSQGSPMIYGGDECLNSQGGNNNAWCQDNETGWLTWSGAKDSQRLREVVRQAIAFRMSHPMLHGRKALRMTDYRSCGCPDLSYHSARAWVLPQEEHSIGVLYCGSYAEDDSIYIAYNMYWEAREYAIPRLRGQMEWRIKADTAYAEVFYPDGEEPLAELTKNKQVKVAPRTVMILLGKSEEDT